MSSIPSGETHLDTLIRSMEPVLHDDVFVFCTVPDKQGSSSLTSSDAHLLALNPVMLFKEVEGITLIVTKEAAIAEGMGYEFPARMITLNIHSALDAVGFLARITQRLAALDMGVNPVSGFYHDHLFVPVDKADTAMSELHQMSEE